MIDDHLKAPHLYSGKVLEVEMEKIRRAVLQSDPSTPPFYTTIARQSLLADVRKHLENHGIAAGTRPTQPIQQVRNYSVLL